MAKMKKSYTAIVIGSGCAGFNAADWLYDLGVSDIALITEGLNSGTSRNTGSDKQTYYKLTLAGDEPDSVYEMAETLFDGGSMHGDTALIQAACSAKAFMKLVNLGLPFPTNKYGAYVGYKTDHDPRQRATSSGPLTSKLMTEALQREVMRKGIPILDGYQVVKLLTDGGRVCGLAAIDHSGDYIVLDSSNIVLATGGPAGIYHDRVFPESQTGASGLAFEAGALGANLQEWQYGLASIDFRWNVSGTYQQVLPKYISVDADGTEHEFLQGKFDDPADAHNMVFLKGYQWPFDVRKVSGSSRVDLLVACENKAGRTVYMDFRRNPTGLDFSRLSAETYSYLEKSGALFGTPIERLAKMNPKAIQLYKDNGIDLYREPLKVAVCAQHCNGGVAVDANWESSIRGLYVVGEAAGTFGVYRPGGSALNDTQVGAMRAAEHIAQKKDAGDLRHVEFRPPEVGFGGVSNHLARLEDIQRRMSRHAAYVRDMAEIEALRRELCDWRAVFFDKAVISDKSELWSLHKCYDTLVAQIFALSAMHYSADHIGGRGSAMVVGRDNAAEDSTYNGRVVLTDKKRSYCEPVRPMPPCDDWFETVWNERQSNIK